MPNGLRDDDSEPGIRSRPLGRAVPVRLLLLLLRVALLESTCHA